MEKTILSQSAHLIWLHIEVLHEGFQAKAFVADVHKHIATAIKCTKWQRCVQELCLHRMHASTNNRQVWRCLSGMHALERTVNTKRPGCSMTRGTSFSHASTPGTCACMLFTMRGTACDAQQLARACKLYPGVTHCCHAQRLWVRVSMHHCKACAIQVR